MTLLVICLVMQALIAQVAPSPWWVPDLTLIGVLVAVVRAPGKWLSVAVVGGLWIMTWTIRFRWPICLGYVALGGVVRLLAAQWDLNDGRILYPLTGISSLLLTLSLLWLDELWSVRLVGLALLRVALTVLALPLVQGLERWLGWGMPGRSLARPPHAYTHPHHE